MSLKNALDVLKVFTITGKYLRLSRQENADIVELKGQWAADFVRHLKLKVEIMGQPAKGQQPILLVGNHISYLDIPILFYSCPDVSFVSKKEVATWPVIGTAARKCETIFVDRSSIRSRAKVKDEIAASLQKYQQKVVIFPSGTTSIKPTPQWKKGAFQIAAENKIQIQPFRIHYQPLRAAAYIENDQILKHMYDLFKLDKVNVKIEFHEPVAVQDSIAECRAWQEWCESAVSH